MSEITVECIVYDGTTKQADRLAGLGFVQTTIANPRYDSELVLTSSDNRFGRVIEGNAILVLDDRAIAVLDEAPKKKSAPVKKAATKK